MTGTQHIQGRVLHGSTITHKDREFSLSHDETDGYIAGIAKVNGRANPAMPQDVGASTEIEGILRITKISDEKPTQIG